MSLSNLIQLMEFIRLIKLPQLIELTKVLKVSKVSHLIILMKYVARDTIRRFPLPSSLCTCGLQSRLTRNHLAVLHSLPRMSCLPRDQRAELHSLPRILPVHALVRTPCWISRTAYAQLMPEIMTTGGGRIPRSQENAWAI